MQSKDGNQIICDQTGLLISEPMSPVIHQGGGGGEFMMSNMVQGIFLVEMRMMTLYSLLLCPFFYC